MAEDAIARARAIAAKLTGTIGLSSELGKRSADAAGLGSIVKKKIYIPVKDHPDINFLGLLIGPRGASMRAMSERTGSKILVKGRGSQREGTPYDPMTDDDELHVSLEGSEEAVDKARREIEEILYNPEKAMRLKQEQLSEMNSGGGGGGGGMSSSANIYGPGLSDDVIVMVPNSLVGLIIGRGGENIQRLQSQTGGHLQIQKESEMRPGDTMRVITLKGTTEAVADLKKRLDEQVAIASAPKMTSRGPRLDQAFVIKVAIPNDKVGIVIGRQGTTLRGIMDRTRANIQIPTAPDDDNPDVRTVSIGADIKEDADAAQMEIFLILQQQQQSAQASMAASAPTNAVCIAIPDDKVGLIIGKGGMTIKDLQQRCRVRVQIPQVPDPGSIPPCRTITIAGTTEGQMLARFEIETILGYTPGSVIGGGYAQTPQPGAQMYGGWGQAQGGQYGGYDMYGQFAQQPQQQYAAGYAADPNMAVPTDPTAYYNDFWQYAAYYGEAAARAYYTAWSPPEGTPPPEGIVLPSAEAASAAAAMGDTSGQQGQQAETQQQPQAQQQQQQQQQQQLQEQETANGGMPEMSEEERQAAVEAWEKYNREYAEWYEKHGKHENAPADPNAAPASSE